MPAYSKTTILTVSLAILASLVFLTLFLTLKSKTQENQTASAQNLPPKTAALIPTFIPTPTPLPIFAYVQLVNQLSASQVKLTPTQDLKPTIITLKLKLSADRLPAEAVLNKLTLGSWLAKNHFQLQIKRFIPEDNSLELALVNFSPNPVTLAKDQTITLIKIPNKANFLTNAQVDTVNSLITTKTLQVGSIKPYESR